MNEVEKIYILGDALGRDNHGYGQGGIALLLRIKELSGKYPGRISYIPGKHDDYLYKYMDEERTEQKLQGEKFLYSNEQYKIIEEVEDLKNFTPREFKDLKTWLGLRPLQVVHKYKGKNYYLAHALFNQKLYNSNPNLCLKDNYNNFGKPNGIEKEISTILCYKDQGLRFDYKKEDLPFGDANNVMVVGHTSRKEFFKLKNEKGEDVSIYVVDNGILTDANEMCKFMNGNYLTSNINLHRQYVKKLRKNCNY